jgi:hypothetical protein
MEARNNHHHYHNHNHNHRGTIIVYFPCCNNGICMEHSLKATPRFLAS